MWSEPKTDWTSSDYVNYTDYNRIKNNIDYLRELALSLYSPFPFGDMGEDKTSYAEFPYADEFNSIEENWSSLAEIIYPEKEVVGKTWYENAGTPTYEDFNRLESLCLKMYERLDIIRKNKERLAFTLGQQRVIKI